MKYLETEVGDKLYELLRGSLRQFLREVDQMVGLRESSLLDSCRARLVGEEAKHIEGPDALFDDLFVLRCFVDLFAHYGKLWRLIRRNKICASWNELQNAFDVLRLVRKFSHIDTSCIEDQLVELQKAYPYNVFFSMGITVGWFECSICGQDIDSFLCLHRKGYLYRGRMAVGIARDIVEIDHVSMVDRPEDRRCVVKYQDDGEQFKLVRLLASLLRERKFVISDFGQLRFSRKHRPNPALKNLGRNDPCYCGSGMKFKRCCLRSPDVEGDHVDIVPNPFLPERAVP
jgi:hypothetical protein